jgi:hypothetical protein
MSKIVIKNRAAATLIASLALVISATVFAQAITIRGASSCGVWIKERQEKKIPTLTNERWLVGYLSGLARALNKDIVNGTDNASIFLWMDNYCQKKPLNDIADGAEDLSRELAKQKDL